MIRLLDCFKYDTRCTHQYIFTRRLGYYHRSADLAWPACFLLFRLHDVISGPQAIRGNGVQQIGAALWRAALRELATDAFCTGTATKSLPSRAQGSPHPR